MLHANLISSTTKDSEIRFRMPDPLHAPCVPTPGHEGQGFPGYCARTGDGFDGLCSSGNKGAWALQKVTNEGTARAACVALCADCARCSFISYSAKEMDCSWFASCRLDRLKTSPAFRSLEQPCIPGADGSSDSQAASRPAPSMLGLPPSDGYVRHSWYSTGGSLQGAYSYWNSQAGQDSVVASLLRCKRNGFFIDLATNDPVRASNSFRLERDFGWTGLCIEANPKYHERIRKKRSCALVPHAIAGHEGNVSFEVPTPSFHGVHGFDSGGFSRLRVRTRAPPANGAYAAAAAGESHYDTLSGRMQTIQVRAMPLRKVLHQHGAPKRIDYMSLDIEGAEELAMSTFPWTRHTISILTVEVREQQTGLKQALLRHGYVLHGQLGHLDHVWVHSSLLPQLRNTTSRWC